MKKKLIFILRRTVDVYSKHEMTVYSGYTTFYFMLSMIPLMMMIISLINMIPWFSVTDITGFLTKIVPDIPQFRSLIFSILVNLNRQSGELITSIFALTSLWSGSHGVYAMMTGLEKINHTNKHTIFKERPKAILYTVLFTLLMPSLLFFQVLRSSIQNAITYVFTRLSLENIAVAINRFLRVSGIVTLAATIFIIVLTFTYLPAGKRTIRSQLPGSVFTSVLWILFTNAFGFFIRRFWKMSSIYGTFAAVFLAAMWLKFIVNILFMGASLNRAMQVHISHDIET